MIGSSRIVSRTIRLRKRSFSTALSVDSLLRELRQLDTSSLCDADKTSGGNGIRVIAPSIQAMNHRGDVPPSIMAGVATTVSFSEPDDFLPVMRALALEARADEVLVVNTLSSTKAVAGEIFVAEARRKGLAGIVIDGPIRDTAHLDDVHSTKPMRMYATGATPYSGTTQSPGELHDTVTCGGVKVEPGDIVVGDDDGVVVGSVEAFSEIIPIAQKIQEIEEKLVNGIADNKSLTSMTNLEDHIQNRLEGKDSNLEFKV